MIICIDNHHIIVGGSFQQESGEFFWKAPGGIPERQLSGKRVLLPLELRGFGIGSDLPGGKSCEGHREGAKEIIVR